MKSIRMYWALLLITAFAFAFAMFVGGCASRTGQSTTPVVTSQVLDTSEDTTHVNGDEVLFEREVYCTPDQECEVNLVVPITDKTTIRLPKPKRSCMGAMALGGLAGVAGGAAYGSIRYPNDVAVSSDRVDVLFDATWKLATVGGAASALVTGVICYATR